VYVIDDDHGIGVAVRRLLESVGIPCATFTSPEDALNELTAESCGCLVMDVRMPVMSGLEAYQVIKERGISLPVIFVTAHQDVPTAVRAMKVGATDLLLKPFNHQALIDAVNAALAQDRQRRAETHARAEVLDRLAHLTPREREVMDLVVQGKLNKQIASVLGTTEKTVKVHRAQVMKKMGAQSLADLVRLAERLGHDS